MRWLKILPSRAIGFPNGPGGHGLQAQQWQEDLQISDDRRDVRVHLVQSDIFDFISRDPAPADLLIAHAFLDLLPMPESLSALFS